MVSLLPPSLLRDPQDYLPMPVSGVQPLVSLADPFQRQHLRNEGPHLATLDKTAHLLKPRPLTLEEYTVKDLVFLVERREVALRAEDGCQAPEGFCGRDALNDR